MWSKVLFVHFWCTNIKYYNVGFLAVSVNMYRDINAIKSDETLKLSLASRGQQSLAAIELEKYWSVLYSTEK